MERKIALVAPHEGMNYGTLLQAFSLAKVIHDLGYECEYISYTPYYKKSLWERFCKKLKRIFKQNRAEAMLCYEKDDYSFWYKPDFENIRKHASEFAKNKIPHSFIVYTPKTISQCKKKYYKYIVGSDQSWSMERYYSEYSFYYLYFVNKRDKRYSYAPSLGTTHLTEQHKRILSKYLDDFDLLSCREQKNCDSLSELVGKPVELVGDPTMLLDKSFWLGFSAKIELPERYVLAYILGNKASISEFAEVLGRKHNIPVYYILTCPEYINKEFVLRDLAVEQWVYAIANATFVVTDSFHGTLFSINLNKQFYSFSKRANNNSILNDNDRIMDFLNIIGLANRFVNDGDQKQICDSSVIDYNVINPSVVALREKSFSFIERIMRS